MRNLTKFHNIITPQNLKPHRGGSDSGLGNHSHSQYYSHTQFLLTFSVLTHILSTELQSQYWLTFSVLTHILSTDSHSQYWMMALYWTTHSHSQYYEQCPLFSSDRWLKSQRICQIPTELTTHILSTDSHSQYWLTFSVLNLPLTFSVLNNGSILNQPLTFPV